jgi:hypothetical protein
MRNSRACWALLLLLLLLGLLASSASAQEVAADADADAVTYPEPPATQTGESLLIGVAAHCRHVTDQSQCHKTHT